MDKKFEKALELIDEKNAQDPHEEVANGQTIPKELLYSKRMSAQLLEFDPGASEELQIAARAQHICRWQVPRNDYPMDRVGYLKWRNDLKKMHAGITAEILEEVGYSEAFINRVTFLIQKKKIKKDDGSQTMEDVICLVFLQHYFDDFAAKHDDEKIISILQKTWAKMSPEGHEAAMKLELSEKTSNLVMRALE